MKKMILLLIVLFSMSSVNGQNIGKQVNVRSDELVIKSHYSNFDKVSLPGSQYTTEIGSPELPMLVYTFVVPQNAKVTGVSVQGLSKRKVDGYYHIYPAQKPIPIGEGCGDEEFEMNKEVYNSNKEYPGKQVEILSDNTESGYHVVTVGVYPVSCIPGSRELFVSDFSFTIEYTLQSHTLDFDKLPRQSPLRAENARLSIQAKVENPEDVERFAPQVNIVSQKRDMAEPDTTDIIAPLSVYLYDEISPDYIIVTSEALKNSFKPLAEWKTQKGVFTIIKTVEEIYISYPGIDKQEKIRNYLIECNDRWGPDLYVLIGGNNDIVPAREVKGWYQRYWVTDLYYATTGSTWYNDSNNGFRQNDAGHNFYVGRVPVKNEDEVSNFITKLIIYEKGEFQNPAYVKNSLYAMAMLSRDNCKTLEVKNQTRYSGGYFGIIENYIKSYMPGDLKVKAKLMIDNATGDGNVYKYSNDYDTACEYDENGIVISKYPGASNENCIYGHYELNSQNLFNELNKSDYHFVYHMDHSIIKAIGASSKDKGGIITGEQISNLANANHPQIMLSNGCEPATFSSPDCFGAKYVNARNGGVAFMGNSDVGFGGEHSSLNSFFKDLYHNKIINLGILYRNLYSDVDQKRRMQLLGDPEMPVWSQTPKTISATAEITATSTGSLQVTMQLYDTPPQGGYRICISKGTDYYYTWIVNHLGTVRMPVSNASSSDLKVVITGKDLKPFIKEFKMPFNNSIKPRITNVQIKDDNSYFTSGNNDKRIDAGEQVAFKIGLAYENTAPRPPLKNSQIQYLDTETRSYVTILKNIVNYETEPTSEQYFVLKFDKDILQRRNVTEILKNDMNPITLRLKTENAYGIISYDEFNIDIFASRLEQGNKEVTVTASGNNRYVNIWVDLFNSGKGPSTGLKAKLTPISSASYYRAVRADNISYPDIKSLETKRNTLSFQFLLTDITKDYPAEYNLEVENKYGKKWNFYFNLNDLPTQQVTQITHQGKESEIFLQWDNFLSNNNIQGYNIYRSKSSSGNYTKVNTSLIKHWVFTDSNLEPLTDYYYKIAVVNTDGNEGALSSPYKANTLYRAKPGFPVRMGFNLHYPSNIGITTFDFTGNGKKDIFTGCSSDDENRKDAYIIGLKSDGMELFDIDFNTTTYSGFLHLNQPISAEIAVGHLDGLSYGLTPQAFVIPRVWGNVKLSSYINADRNNDGQPDTKLRMDLPGSDYSHGAVLSNINQDSRARLSIITASNEEKLKLSVFNYDGTLRWTKTVPSNEWVESRIGVSNLGNDRYKDIVIGTDKGVYAYDYSGKSLGSMVWNPIITQNNNPVQLPTYPIFSKSGYTFQQSAPVFCDLDGDGVNEIIIRGMNTSAIEVGSKNQYNSSIFVLDRKGRLKQGWGNNNTRIADYGLMGLAVADIYGNGNMYVVELGYEVINIYNKDGVRVVQHHVPGLIVRQAPIIADLDGDTEAEVIVIAGDKILAYKMNGSMVNGFPIQIEAGRKPRLAVDDLDRRGRSDLIAVSYNTVYAWETNGRAQRIEWGIERGNSRLTGEYVRPVVQADAAFTENKGNENIPTLRSYFDKEDCILYQNVPNPANSTTKIDYYAACEGCQIQLHVYNLQGGIVKSFTGLSNGQGSVSVNTDDLSTGIYLYSLIVNGERIDTKRMMVTH